MTELLRSKIKVKKKLKTRFVCIGTVAYARKVNVTMFIMMKTVIFICRGRHEGITNEEKYRDIQGQTRTDRDRQGQTMTCRDRQGHTRTSKDKQGQKGNVSVCPCLSLFVPVLSPLVPALSLLVPACPCAVPGKDRHNCLIPEFWNFWGTFPLAKEHGQIIVYYHIYTSAIEY